MTAGDLLWVLHHLVEVDQAAEELLELPAGDEAVALDVGGAEGGLDHRLVPEVRPELLHA